VRGVIDARRRTQLMQHHTATHLMNGALRELLGPHVWQAGAYKGPEAARIDVTHYRALSPAEVRTVERRVNQLVREDRPVKSYFEPRTEAERRFGFSLYQGGAIPGRELRLIDIDGFDVEACGGTHCTHTSEVGEIAITSTERIQDGIVRVNYVAGERALDLREEQQRILGDAAKKLGVPTDKVPEGIDRLLAQLAEGRQAQKTRSREEIATLAQRLVEGATTEPGALVIAQQVELDRAGVMELSRALTRAPRRVAILTTEHEGRGLLFIGSSEPSVPADQLLASVLPTFGGRGGGNPSAATATGEPGQPLATAVAEARDAARRQSAGEARG
jgi:alanyl-tRNA synthetase